MQPSLRDFLDRKVKEYNRPSFIKDDPVCIPHAYSTLQDIEIAGFFAAVFAWGNRTTIINKSREVLQLMDNAPHQFITQHYPADLMKLMAFKHRTFNTTDLLYFIAFLRFHYSRYNSLEDAFLLYAKKYTSSQHIGIVEAALSGFYYYFFSLDDAPPRTRKHIASSEKGSTCKRLNMFLRWMVRKDSAGVDLGLWKKISPAQLICPVDLHVARVARHFGLLQRNAVDWTAAVELTAQLQQLDKNDPVKYDFALFGLGVMEKF